MKLIPYICCGDPNLNFSYDLVKTLIPYSDAIELGIPFSDPIADGKTIQAAIFRALKNKITVLDCFALVKKIRKENTVIPLYFMTYSNIVYSFGIENFFKKMNSLNMQGIVIPDLPFEEDENFEKFSDKYKIEVIKLITLNTRKVRLRRLLKYTQSFAYLVSSTGTTGTRNGFAKESIAFVKRVRKLTQKQLFVGFGIADKTQVNVFAKAGADGVVIGSKFIELYSKKMTQNSKNRIKNAKKVLFDIKKLAQEIKSAKTLNIVNI
ncbi:MAG: tryptophan synthase subunit alpha [Candidatus Diapherotrites archaeon]|nr:tryptophan synthase subunit alpha [Candidatus Diapherotrites archaeon]